MPGAVVAADVASAAAGLGSATSWGAGDFAGGIATRRASVQRIVLVTQMVGVAVLAVIALALREALPTYRDLLWSGAAGISGGVGILALYTALASGRMGVVAPVTGVIAALLPVLVGIAIEGSPGPLPLVGFALALGGIVLVSRPEGMEAPRRTLLLAVLAGMGFAGFLVSISQASGTGIVWPIVAARLTTAALVLALIAFGRPHGPHASPFPWSIVLLAGILDTGGNVGFVLAATLGRLDMAAVLSSFYPAITALLARIVLGERLARIQEIGFVLLIVSLPLMTW